MKRVVEERVLQGYGPAQVF